MCRPGSVLAASAKNLAALLLGLGLAAVVAEIALIPFVTPQHYRYPQPLHQPDERLGWVLIPGEHGYTIDQPVTINALGFRSPEIAVLKQPGGVRVLCLGDSQTFGNGVAQDATYPARLQSLLAARLAARRVEVINAGVQAYDTIQEVSQLELLAPRLKPDVVTLGFYINDIGETLRPDRKTLVEKGSGEFGRNGFIRRLAPYRLIYLLKRSRLVTLTFWRLQLLMGGGRSNPVTEVLEGRTPEPYEEGWRAIEQALVRARALAAADGFELIVFPVPAGQEFRGSYPNEQYRSRFLALATKLGLDHFDLTPTMKAAGGGYQAYFIPWDSHINSRTHDLIARSLADRILGELAGRAGRAHA
jgi:lysophospholipase L1-like esterase